MIFSIPLLLFASCFRRIFLFVFFLVYLPVKSRFTPPTRCPSFISIHISPSHDTLYLPRPHRRLRHGAILSGTLAFLHFYYHIRPLFCHYLLFSLSYSDLTGEKKQMFEDMTQKAQIPAGIEITAMTKNGNNKPLLYGGI